MLRVARLVEDQLGQLGVLHALDGAAPALERRDQIGQRLARAAGQLLRLHDLARGLIERHAAAGARQLVQAPQGGIAEPALGHVENALEFQVVDRVERHLQVGDGVLDLLALVEPGAADDAVGQAQGDEAVLEGAHLEGRPHKDRDAVQPLSLLAQGLDVVADGARLLLVVPQRREADALAHGIVGEQRLAEAALVVGDEAGGGGQDMTTGAVVTLQPDHLGAGEIGLEAQDVVHLGAAPAVDGLIVVADAADVRFTAGQQPQPQVLGHVGVLVFVDQDVAEPALVVGQHVRVLAKQPDRLQQEIAEVDRVQLLEALLVGRVELRPLAFREGEGLAARHFVRRDATVLPAVDEGGELARRPAVLVEVGALDDLLDEAQLVVRVEDGEAGLEAHQLAVPAQDLDADGVERAEPRHPFQGAAHQLADALLHLARGLVGERHGQDLPGLSPPRAQDMGNASGEHARLTRPGAGQHQHRAVECLHGRALLRVEALHVRGRGAPQRTGGIGERGRRGGGRGYGGCRASRRHRPAL